MIAAAQPTPDEPDEPQGVLGDGALRPGKYNMALVRRAIREDWPIPNDLRRALVEQMGAVLTSQIEVVYAMDEEDREEVIDSAVRNKIAAAKVLIAADSVNAKREAMDQKDEHLLMPKLVLHGRATVTEMTNEQLDRIIAGDFTAIEDASGFGTQGPQLGNGESA
jgi:hypothetical protein